MRLALLLCDTPVPAVLEREGTYLDIFRTWLESCNPGVELDIDAFDAVNLELPSAIESYDAVMLTGSKFDAHDTTLPFVQPLYDFCKRVAATNVKLVGICFGHQIIANALGGKSGRGEGWEVGVYENEATEEGKKIWGDRVYAQQMHRDHVYEVPPDFHVLLYTKRYSNHSMVRYYKGTDKPQVITIQGHPEFTPAIITSIIDAREASGVLNAADVAEARSRVQGGEGRKLGQIIWRIILARGPWTIPEFVGGQATRDFLKHQSKVLVIGAGGLGCEILQDLALSGFGDIHVIDMDTIDISNLNRQFLFRESDVGESKAICAANFCMKRVPGIKVTPYHGKIQDHPPSFYSSFDIIIAGLDSISARRWINATLVELAEENIVPLVDGGTEGFRGQARVIIPSVSSCYECSIDTITPPTAFPICTIANTPRLPEHCIEWASVLEWPKVFKDKKLDTDDPEHIEWLYKQASDRASQFNIEGVTWALTQGVVKNIIPAIASTNAIIAAACCNEAYKLATSAAPSLDNYMMYNGSDSVYAYTFEYEKRPDCPVCGGESIQVQADKEWTLEVLLEKLENRQDMQIKRPSLSYNNQPLFYQAPPQLHEATKPNLAKRLIDIFGGDAEIVVTDPNLPFTVTVELKL